MLILQTCILTYFKRISSTKLVLWNSLRYSVIVRNLFYFTGGVVSGQWFLIAARDVFIFQSNAFSCNLQSTNSALDCCIYNYITISVLCIYYLCQFCKPGTPRSSEGSLHLVARWGDGSLN